MGVIKINEIKDAVITAAKSYPLKRVELFGSYAENKARRNSDLDILVEFYDDGVSLITLSGLKYMLEDILNINVDVVEMPIPKDSLLQIERTVKLYEQ